ncbi:dihydroorotase [bacterium]|nr:dihydroorotase [bacterium]
MTSLTAIINGRLVDPVTNTEDITNIFLDETGMVVGLGYVPEEDAVTSEVIDLKGKYIISNIIDSHVSLREPGEEDKETLATASKAALSGGITLLISTPDTHPIIDTPEMVSFIHGRRKESSLVPIYPLGALSKNMSGLELAELYLMSDAGAVGFTDGNSLEHTGLMRHALHYSSDLDRPVIITPEDPLLSQNGVMNEGSVSTVLGLKGIPAESEEVRLSRDIKLLERFGGFLHVFPVTTRATVDLIRKAKARGLSITCGTAPHYLMFDESDIEGYDPIYKCRPPLRTRDDIEALIEGISDGTIDILASHHQPHTIDGKRTDFVSAEYGMSGIDTFLPSVITALVHRRAVPLPLIAKLLSTNPKRIFRLKKPGVAINTKPSFTVIDTKTEMSVDQAGFGSKSKLSPFHGMGLVGWPVMTIIDGKILWRRTPRFC